VVQKFNETKNWNCTDLVQLYDKIDNRKEANAIVNNLKICDPAVGSGHFLVSALNEIIAIKSDLKILIDRDGKRLKEYSVEVQNDELIVTDDEGELFDYNPRSKESQRLQETLFHEKQTIIENCLFGVDVNPNSVKICRLRLWIELLKNTYYRPTGELETLPNIDINIKCGNSLISRYNLKLKKAHGFYGVITIATLIGLMINFIGIDPIKALVFTAVFNGVAAVPLIFLIARIARNKKIMGEYRSGWLSNMVVWITFLVMTL